MEEEYRDIEGYVGLYQVSNLGNIRSLPRLDKNGRRIWGKMLKTATEKDGYQRIRLSVDGRKITLKVHRAVAIAFIDNVNNKPQVNHIDGDKSNNMVSNLEWCTNKENQQHAVDTGLRTYETGKKATRFISPVQVYDMNMNYLYELNGNIEMAEKGFDYRLVSAVVRGKRNHHRKHIFRRKEL